MIPLTVDKSKAEIGRGIYVCNTSNLIRHKWRKGGVFIYVIPQTVDKA